MKNLLLSLIISVSGSSVMANSITNNLKEEFKTLKEHKPQLLEYVFAENKLYDCSYGKKINQLHGHDDETNCDVELSYARSLTDGNSRVLSEFTINDNIQISIKAAIGDYLRSLPENRALMKSLDQDAQEADIKLPSFDEMYNKNYKH